MVEMKAVVEVTGGHLVLSGRMTRHEFDTALAAIDEYNRDEDSPEPCLGLLERELIIMSGGLAVRDTETGVRIGPGCCFGLEDWRDWGGLLDGEVPWLGHSPTPGVEVAAGVVTLRQDEERAGGPTCQIAIAELPGHLECVRQDLIGFVELVRKWAPHGIGEELAARFDQDFRIGEPL
ncbi:hypothetical protein [Lentzea sp. E54]|uniref:hypothetical protein n=1 Tax=Lentzea xerophila TaxID=3435883 RepID=UPI003DA33209